MYVLIFFHPKKQDRKRIRHKQKRTGFGQRRPSSTCIPPFLCPSRGKRKKAYTVRNKFTTLSFHIPFLSLWDIMMLTWSIILYPPWQFLNTNFLLPSLFQPQSAFNLAINCPTSPIFTIAFLSDGSDEGQGLLAACFVLHPLTKK